MSIIEHLMDANALAMEALDLMGDASSKIDLARTALRNANNEISMEGSRTLNEIDGVWKSADEQLTELQDAVMDSLEEKLEDYIMGLGGTP